MLSCEKKKTAYPSLCSAYEEAGVPAKINVIFPVKSSLNSAVFWHLWYKQQVVNGQRHVIAVNCWQKLYVRPRLQHFTVIVADGKRVTSI